MEAVKEACWEGLEEVHMVAFKDGEADTLEELIGNKEEGESDGEKTKEEGAGENEAKEKETEEEEEGEEGGKEEPPQSREGGEKRSRYEETE